MATNVKTGTYTGTGAALNVSLGFEPDYVKIWRTDVISVSDEWFSGMAAATSLTSATDAAAAALRAAPHGVTVYPGAAGVSAGFSVGANLSVNTGTYRFVAIENGPGGN